MTRRVLFYVQHLLGIGHLRRAEILAHAMATAGLDVTIAYGGLPLSEAPFRSIHVAELPAATIANEDFSTLRDATGRPVDEAWKAARRDALLDIWRRTDADVVLIELFPFGRRQFRFELIPLLEAIHAAERRPAVACSVRDILVTAKKPGRDEETIATLRRFFDAILVHGDPTLIPLGSTFGAADRIADLICYTGYVAADHATEATDAEGEVIVSAGGGAVGAPILFAALAVRPLTPLANNIWRFLTGPNLPDSDFDKLAAQADPRTAVERFRSDFAARLRVAALSISQGGYNTTMNLLQSEVPAIVVPFETKSETEQRLRAELIAARGVLTLVPAAELSPERLALAVRSALERPRPAPRIDLAGASTTAQIITELAARRTPERRR